MARPLIEGREPTGRSEAEIRANIINIPTLLLLAASDSPEMMKVLEDEWWEEINLYTIGLDHLEALAMNRNRA